METVSKRVKVLLFVLVMSVYVSGLFVKVMNIDAAQYASMSQQIYASKHFFQTLLMPKDYLDKPPLLFSLSALSFKVFGVSTVAYKIPSLLIIFIGFYATYRLGKILFSKEIGVLAACILCACEGIIYFTNDVRTDAILVGLIIFSLWQITEFYTTRRVINFLGAFVGFALAMLDKGPIGLMVPVLAFSSFLIAKRDYKMFFKWYWLIGGLIILILLFPMLWGLYREFGWHGIRFYFWTQSFGRITGENSWHDDSGYFYFVHTFLWSFLPWMFLAYYSIGAHLVQVIKSKFSSSFSGEMLLLGGTVLPFIALSCVHYKLPHYIFVIFPQAAILTSKTIVTIINSPKAKKLYKSFFVIQTFCSVAGWLLALASMTIFFLCTDVLIWSIALLLIGTTLYFMAPRHNAFVRLIVPSMVAILGVNLIVNIHFFPKLLSYQGGSTAASRLQQYHAPFEKIYGYQTKNHAFCFYMQNHASFPDSSQLQEILQKDTAWVYTNFKGYSLIRQMGFTPTVIDSFPDFRVTRTTGKFLFYKTRPSVVKQEYILQTVPMKPNEIKQIPSKVPG